jgi:hypothetical protein
MPSLELVATYPRPAGIDDHCWHVYGLPGAGLVGLLRDATTLQTYRVEPGVGLAPVQAYSLPPGDRCEVAFHPDGQRLAVAAADGVHLLTPGGDRLALERGRLGGAPRAVLFDRRGELLFASYEDGAGQSHACLLELQGAGLERVASVPLLGVEKSYHALALHPSSELLVAQVSCGQDGTWASFVAFRDRTVARLPVALERPGEAFTVVGFAPSGRWLAALSAGRVELLSWPGLSPLAAASPRDGELFDWHACYVGEHLIAASLAPAAASYRLVVWDGELRPVAHCAWQKADQRYLFDLAGLSERGLLVVGDRRAGLLRFNPR